MCVSPFKNKAVIQMEQRRNVIITPCRLVKGSLKNVNLLLREP